jgi:hypothetical protein
MLVAYICLCEAMMSWNAIVQIIGPVYLSCYLGFD